jgi:hypothetical protein
MLSSDDDWQFVRHYFGAELDQSNFRDNQAQYRSIRVRFSEGYMDNLLTLTKLTFLNYEQFIPEISSKCCLT